MYGIGVLQLDSHTGETTNLGSILGCHHPGSTLELRALDHKVWVRSPTAMYSMLTSSLGFSDRSELEGIPTRMGETSCGPGGESEVNGFVTNHPSRHVS